MLLPRHYALIPAAGIGARIAAGCPKQYLPLAGKPMLLHALETFAACSRIVHTHVVVSVQDEYIDEVMRQAPHLSGRVSILRTGGPSRHESVLNGLEAISKEVSDHDWVMVHDAARPGLSQKMLDRLIDELADDPVGGLLALPVVDTLKRSGPDGRAKETISREGMWAAQTPQMFRYGLICQALKQAQSVTDESSAVEALGKQPRLVKGSTRNFKITLPGDIALAERYLKDVE